MSEKNERAAWIGGPKMQCATKAANPGRSFRMVLLGAPGVGKGTQAEMLCERLGTCQLSTGDVFRAAKCMDESQLSPAMVHALGYMQRGELVPDDTVIDMVKERIGCLKCQNGFLLDGFPRTASQAGALDQMLASLGLKLDAVLNFELPLEQVVERLGGRRTCQSCKTTFHVVSKPPQVDGICDRCGGTLYTREDDRPESIRVRLQAYEDSTKPLVEYYAKAGTLVSVSADGAPGKVFENCMEELRKRMDV